MFIIFVLFNYYNGSFNLDIQVTANIIRLVKGKCIETTNYIETTTIITAMSREKAKIKLTITIVNNST